MSNRQNSQDTDVYEEAFTELYTPASDYEVLDPTMDDATLDKMLITSLEADRDHWNNAPWLLEKTDKENTAFLLGDQINDKEYLQNDSRYIDNRLFSSARAILSYATGQLAKPDITPSRGDDVYIKGAQDIGAALYQHSADEKVDYKVRAAVLNLISRKRGYLKMRFDPNLGLNGDITTEICNPEDIIIDRYAGYLQNPAKIYHRIRCSIEKLCARFPDKADEIKEAFNIRRSVHTQMSKMVTYFECWFTYTASDGRPKEGVCWFIKEKHIILDKMPNPNWVYMKSRKKEMEANVTSTPPKPFVIFNYINTGHSYIDETCLIEQAKPQQEMLNKRGRQIWENADYVNGRWIASKKAFSQEDAYKLVNKGAKTIALANRDDVTKALMNVASSALPSYVENTLYDARNEIDQIMGTPSIFRGSQPDKADTLGRDLIVKQQAGALQDDLVRCIAMTMEEYYKMKLQLMRVYYTDDYWFQTKGGDGKYEFILLNGEKLDANVKVSVQTDSTLPLDKASIRATAMDLWQAGNAIDYKTLMEDLGLPNPDIRAERYLRQNADPMGYLASIESDKINADAESDIDLLIANKTPEERDNYDQAYFDYFNKYIAGNRFAKLQGDNPKASQRIFMFITAVQHAMMQSLQLQESMMPQQQPSMPGQPQANMPPSNQPLPPQQPGVPPNPAQQPQAALNPAVQPPMPNPGTGTAPPVPTQ